MGLCSFDTLFIVNRGPGSYGKDIRKRENYCGKETKKTSPDYWYIRGRSVRKTLDSSSSSKNPKETMKKKDPFTTV